MPDLLWRRHVSRAKSDKQQKKDTMAEESTAEKQTKGMSVFERYLTVWIILCIVAGIILGKVAPGFAKYLDGLAISVNGAPVVSIPIAVCLFFMMYPIMVKIDFAEGIKTGQVFPIRDSQFPR